MLHISVSRHVQGIRDSNATMRASSLSNLADVCQCLGYGVQTYIQEVLLVVRDIALSDPDVQVSKLALRWHSDFILNVSVCRLDVLQSTWWW